MTPPEVCFYYFEAEVVKTEFFIVDYVKVARLLTDLRLFCYCIDVVIVFWVKLLVLVVGFRDALAVTAPPPA